MVFFVFIQLFSLLYYSAKTAFTSAMNDIHLQTVNNNVQKIDLNQDKNSTRTQVKTTRPDAKPSCRLKSTFIVDYYV